MSRVVNCARCGSTHEHIEWQALTHPIVDEDGTAWTHWAPCPTNGEPILQRTALWVRKYRTTATITPRSDEDFDQMVARGLEEGVLVVDEG